ncbi:MAG: dTDP-4-dehydrorhamnose 3,5-epimerase family protein [Deltaproteobacteria bacterium]|nr:dTDP-4-dehydrorhamnose 3,5-epimerase family protein [Deltaproteobacteria bacterium]
MNLVALNIEGAFAIKIEPQHDERGAFARIFCERHLSKAGFDEPVRQINLSQTMLSGTVRGLHFQHPPMAEVKLVHCLRGSVFDVILDIRKGSPTFLQWHGQILSGKDCNALIVPRGCAHGFQTLTDDVEMLYVHSQFYDAAKEGGIHCADPRISIKWPLNITSLSPRDAAFPPLRDDFSGIEL